MSQRTDQFAQQIKESLAMLIAREVELPSEVVVGITRVMVSDDLKNTTVFISVFPHNRQGTALDLLRSQAKHLRHELAGEIFARVVPFIRFAIDDKEAYGSEVDRILSELDLGKADTDETNS